MDSRVGYSVPPVWEYHIIIFHLLSLSFSRARSCSLSRALSLALSRALSRARALSLSRARSLSLSRVFLNIDTVVVSRTSTPSSSACSANHLASLERLMM